MEVKTYIGLHKVFAKHIEMFTENSPPAWLTSNVFNWWWEEHVLTLDVEEFVDSDFRIIIRTS